MTAKNVEMMVGNVEMMVGNVEMTLGNVEIRVGNVEMTVANEEITDGGVEMTPAGAYRKARKHASEGAEARNGRHEPPNAIRKAMDAVSIIGLHHPHAAAHHEPHRDDSSYPRHGQKKYAETHQRASAYPICLTTYFLNE